MAAGGTAMVERRFSWFRLAAVIGLVFVQGSAFGESIDVYRVAVPNFADNFK